MNPDGLDGTALLPVPAPTASLVTSTPLSVPLTVSRDGPEKTVTSPVVAEPVVVPELVTSPMELVTVLKDGLAPLAT